MQLDRFKTKKMRYGINATVLTVMFIIAIILVNMLAGVITEKFPSVNIDLSENGQFAISKATKDAIKDIDKDILMTVVVYDQEEDIFVDELISRYKEINSKISSLYVDLAKNPTVMQKYEGLNPTGSLVVEANDRYEVIDFDTLYGQVGRMEDAESYVTNAIISVTSDDEKKILFTQGHGEKEFDTLKKTFEKKFFETGYIDLTKDEISGCDVLAICAPSADFTQQEINIIENYVLKGGSIQVYFDPGAAYLPNIAEYVKEWGIEIKNEVVSEKDSSHIYSGNNGFLPVVSENDYTKNVNPRMLYKQSFRMDILFSENKGVTNYPLLTTTDKATTVANSVDTGVNGQYNIVVMCERVLDDNSIVKMLMSGSTLNFEQNYENQYVGNADMAMAVTEGMLNAEDYVKTETKKSSSIALQMTLTQVVFILVVLVLIAIGILVFGIVVWGKRRYL